MGGELKRTPSQSASYRERMRVQCLSWAMGNPYHERTDNECCPDFSCCDPALFERDEAARWSYYHEHYGARQ